MKKYASILDYSHPSLDPSIWDRDLKLYSYHKDFILRLINTMYQTYGFKQSELWVEDIVIIGSLTTSKWLLTSDLDVHIRVDIEAFKNANMPEVTIEQAFAVLDETRKKFDRAKILAPMTQHPIEFYFESVAFFPSNVELVGVYSVPQDTWLKEPIILPADLDFEESKRDVVAQAEALAQGLDASFGKIKRDIQRIDELEIVIKGWDAKTQQLFYAKVEQKLNDIEAEITNDLRIRQELVDARHAGQDAVSDTEIKFKYLARFGFFSILGNLKTLMEETGGNVTPQELPIIKKIISEGSVEKTATDAYYHGGSGSSIRQIAKDGFVVAPLETGSRNQSPLAGRAYLTKDLCYALIYALGADMVGQELDPDYINGGPEGGIVLVAPNEDTLIPDEDWLGEQLTSGFNGESNSVYDTLKFQQALLPVFNNMKKQRRDRLWDMSYQSMIGKMAIRILQNYNPDYLKQLAKESKSVSHEGNMKVLQAWIFNKEQDNPKLKKDGSNFFQIAQEIPVTKTASLKEAFLKEAFEKEVNTDICVDLDRTIAEPAKYPKIGEPIEGAKEALEKLQEMGYSVIIYSCRADTEEGLDLIREYLDKHDLPYDSIFEGDKPFAKYYIDDRAISFDGNWDNVLKQVEKSEKKASLTITADKIYTRDELERMDIDDLDRMAYGHASGELIELNPSDINIQYPVDLSNPEYKFEKGGMNWVKSVDFSEPVKVSIKQDGKFYLEDGHHRWFAANKLGLPLMAEIEVKGKPIETILERQPVMAKQAKLSQKYWIDPSGKEFKVNDDHGTWLGTNHKLLEGYGYKFADDVWSKPDGWFEIANAMITDGWTRVTTESDYDFAIEVADINNLPSYLDNFVAQHYTGGGVEIDDLAGDYQDLEDPFPSLTKQIAKAQSRRQMAASKPFSKKAINLYDPLLKQGPVHAIYAFEQPIDEEGNTISMYHVLGDHPRCGSTVSKQTLNELGIPVPSSKIAQTKKVKQGDYSCLLALVPHDLAQEIVEWGVREIPDDKLYQDEDGNLGRELESHITVKYGFLTNDAKPIRRSFNDEKPFKAKLGKVRHFQPPERDFDVITVEVISEDLNRVNKRVTEDFDCAEDLVSDVYHPHVTVAYVKRDTAKEFIGSDVFEGKELELDTLIFSPHKGNRTYFSVSQDKESSFVLEKINKFAYTDIGYWIDPNGDVFDPHSQGLIHNEWVLGNLEMLRDKYGINVPADIIQQAEDYFYEIQEDVDNADMPASDEIWKQMITSGWVRVGEADEGIGIEVNDLHSIPPFVESILAEDLRDGMFLRVEDINHNMVSVQYPYKNLQQAVNKELIAKTATISGSLYKWIASDGKVFNVSYSHYDWMNNNLNILKNQYKLKLPEKNGQWLENQVKWLISQGWTRVDGNLPGEISLQVNDLNNVPQVAEQLIWKYKPATVFIEDLNDNVISFDQEEYAKGLMKKAEFLPSMAENAPTNNWQFAEGGDDVEIALQPDSVSDDTTEAEPCTTGKPRTKEVWRQFISMFSNPFSKKEPVTIDSAYDPEMDEKEKEEMSLDQTQLEYSKGFYDPKDHDFPHNTTWDSLIQDGEPSKPTSVTYSPQISNEDNLDQNSPGGYPRRFMGRPKGEWSSTDGEITPALVNMLKNHEAAIDNMTIDITAMNWNHAYWIDPSGKTYEVRGKSGHENYAKETHGGWIQHNLEMLKNDYGLWGSRLDSQKLIEQGWIRIGDSFDNSWGITVKNLDNIPSTVDSCLAQFAHDGAKIGIEGQDNGMYEVIQWPVKSVQQAVNKARLVNANLKKIAITRQYALYVGGRLAIRTLTRNKALQICKSRFPAEFAKGNYEIKQEAYTVSSLNKNASVEEVDGTKVFINPSEQELKNISRSLTLEDGVKMFRGLIDPKTGDLYVWDAYLLLHDQVIAALGLDITYDIDSPYCLYFPPHQISDVFYKQQQVRERNVLPKEYVEASKKQAGNQSASVPDYLMDEWKTEQINNNTDEEPYVNHDQRDYPYGLHDSPENTDSGIGWAKDNQPYVVRLDILENPAFREDPFGIGSYDVTYYTGMPASDGIETTNP